MRKKMLLLTGLVLLILLAVYSPVQANWTFVHGTGGFFERPDLVKSNNPSLPSGGNASVHFGIGLNFTQSTSAGSLQWVHYAIPVNYPTKYKRISVKFSTDHASHVFIRRIEVWNGSTKVATFNPPTTYAWGGATKEVKLKLPGTTGHKFRNGMNICINPVVVLYPVEDLTGTFNITNVGVSDT